jgi:hypothetical protein
MVACTWLTCAALTTACSSSESDASANPGPGIDGGAEATQADGGGGDTSSEGAPGSDATSPSDAGWPGYDAATSEFCGNGLDDDQNGQVDDGCPCSEGATQQCYGANPLQAGVGVCVWGSQTCETTGSGEFASTAWGACAGFGKPADEVCNGVDDDCDGTVDDGAPCSGGLTCAGGQCVEQCTPVNGGWTEWACTTCSPCVRVCTRECSNPAPSCGGTLCQGEASRQESCAGTAEAVNFGQGSLSLGACGEYAGTVPAGVSQLTLALWGAGGGGGAPGTGGGGAYVRGTIAVNAGDVVALHVGCGGMKAGGGGGATYVYVNGQVVMVAAGGGGGGSDGCSGCSGDENPAYGNGGAGGPVGGAGQDGVGNDYLGLLAGGGQGATASGGGAGGVFDDQSSHSFSECTTSGFAGSKDTGGANSTCQCEVGKSAVEHFGGCSGCGNGGGGGGGSGFFGGGGGAGKFTYVGGGGGGGSSWVDSSRVSSVTSEGGSYQTPGGVTAPGYLSDAGRGGRGQTDPFDHPQFATLGADGRIVVMP